MKWAGNLRSWGSYAIVLAIILGSSVPAWAHNEPAVALPPIEASPHECSGPQPWLPAAQPTSSSTPEAHLAILLFVLTAVATAHALGCWRRTAALGLVLVLCTFTFGTAVHAVHHLSDPGKTAECLVFSASQQISGTLDKPCDLRAPGVAVTTDFPTGREAPSFTHRCRVDLPRAPPSGRPGNF
jgi:hypothetical protein